MKAEALIQVIQSLNKGEKKKFRKAFPQSPPEFIQLYDWIIRTPNPDQEGMQGLLGKKGSAFGNIRRRLWQALETYLTNESKDQAKNEYYALVLSGELIRRQCYKAAITVIEEGKAMCRKSENLNCHLELLKRESELPWNFRANGYEQERQEIELAFYEITQLEQIEREIPKGLMSLQSKDPKISFLEELQRRKSLTNPPERKTLIGQYKNRLVLRKAYQLTGKYYQAIAESKKILELLDSSPSPLTKRAEKQLDELSILMFLYDIVGDLSNYYLMLQKIAAFEADTPILKAQKLIKYFVPGIVDATDQAQPNRGERLIADFLPLWEESETLVEPKDRLRIYVYLIRFYWTAEKPQKVLQWISRMEENRAIHPDLFDFFCPFILQMEICALVWLDEFELIESKLRALKYQLSKNENTLEFFRLFIRVVSAIQRNPEETDNNEVAPFLEKINILKSHPTESDYFGFVDVSVWMEARITKQPMIQVLKNRLEDSEDSAQKSAS